MCVLFIAITSIEFLVNDFKTFYFFTDKSKVQKATNYTDKNNLIDEFELRSAHNQYHIDMFKQSIKVYLKHKYDHEFDELADVIPNLNRFLCYCKQNPVDDRELSCPDDILNMDVLKYIKKYVRYSDGSATDIRMMTMEENFIYRNLIENENIDKIVHLKKIPKGLSDEEKEKALYKKYHDHLMK